MPKPTSHRAYVNGKGDWYRDVDRKKYEENFDRIFRKKTPIPSRSENYRRAMQRSAEIKRNIAFDRAEAEAADRIAKSYAEAGRAEERELRK